MKIKILFNILLCRLGIRSVLPVDAIMGVDVVENNEPMVSVSEIKTSNMTTNVHIVRITVLKMLKQANKFLPNGYNIVLIEGYRSLSAQKRNWQKRVEGLQAQFPKLSLLEIEKIAIKFSAKPGSSGHGTGGAVDVSVYDSNGDFIDMGSSYSEATTMSHTKSKRLTEQQKKNRKILVLAMKKAGFVNYPLEWWHWSYGDKMWAAYLGNKEAIYDNSDSLFKENNVVITAVGDVTLAYHFNSFFENIFSDRYDYPFSKIKEYFKYSITIANLECVLTTHNQKAPKKFNFKGNPDYVKCLSLAGIDIVNVANNHIGDFGSKGIEDTLNALKSNGIKYCGAGKTLQKAREMRMIESNKIKIAFLGYDDTEPMFRAGDNTFGAAYCLDRYIKNDIVIAVKKSDVVIVSFHYGKELAKYPSERQKHLSRLAIDYGATIVFGHHPHTIQGIEKYKDGIIFYSLGNFCFGGNRNPRDKDTFIAKINVSKDRIEKVDIIPVKISSSDNFNDFSPRVIKGNEARRIINKIKERSRYFKRSIFDRT